MKKLLKIGLWFILSITFQLVLLFYFDKAFLGREHAVELISYSVENEVINGSHLKIPADAQQTSVSFNGAYAAYISNDNLTVVNTQSKREIKDFKYKHGTIYYFQWFKDRNLLIFTLKLNTGKVIHKLITFDADSGITNEYPELKNLPEESKVADIAFSPLTNMTYFKLGHGNSPADVYRYDILNNLMYLMRVDAGTEILKSYTSDLLFYQKDLNKAYIKRGLKNQVDELKFPVNTKLLDIDVKDRIYAGVLNSQKQVVKIKSADAALLPDTRWNERELKQAVKLEDVFVTPGGKIYIAVTQEHYIYNIDSHINIPYQGRMIQVLDDFMVTVSGQNLKIARNKE